MIEEREVAVPDLGDEFVAVAEELLQALHALVGAPPADSPRTTLPAVLADGSGIEALDRIWMRVLPTQELTSPRLVGTDRHTELGRLSFVTLAAADLATLGHAIREIGSGHLRGEPRITELLATFADTAPPPAVSGHTPGDIVASFAAWHGLLDLAWTSDAEQLRHHIATAAADREVLLDAAAQQAHERLTERFAAMWGPRNDTPTSPAPPDPG
ncbi:hypothetical protein [Pseudonocardia sp. GCM10023141]|uniref:hypothetical protein n=1 Tax=Pseudonocardia sp. GCM10023141 TaxID=3252653 RepID=UPI003609839D